jgi:hypothetical protein
MRTKIEHIEVFGLVFLIQQLQKSMGTFWKIIECMLCAYVIICMYIYSYHIPYRGMYCIPVELILFKIDF